MTSRTPFLLRTKHQSRAEVSLCVFRIQVLLHIAEAFQSAGRKWICFCRTYITKGGGTLHRNTQFGRQDPRYQATSYS